MCLANFQLSLLGRNKFVLIRAPQFAPANGSFGHQTRGGLWGSQFVSESSRLGLELGVSNHQLENLGFELPCCFGNFLGLGFFLYKIKF